jgi:hypothetical protein
LSGTKQLHEQNRLRCGPRTATAAWSAIGSYVTAINRAEV